MIKVGMVGVGAISGIYLENITNMFKEIEIIGVCDLIRERAENAVKNVLNCVFLTVQKWQRKIILIISPLPFPSVL